MDMDTDLDSDTDGDADTATETGSTGNRMTADGGGRTGSRPQKAVQPLPSYPTAFLGQFPRILDDHPHGAPQKSKPEIEELPTAAAAETLRAHVLFAKPKRKERTSLDGPKKQQQGYGKNHDENRLTGRLRPFVCPARV
ncbi:GD12803 [Drosophila simulans]|uniref:GD12803 n=1 Tax=Drosophila simulans TaxID=7240 RepID=B4QQ62_DROSI|nr:GD12803 [Drosophila simulans]